jgi:hypothetical protein
MVSWCPLLDRQYALTAVTKPFIQEKLGRLDATTLPRAICQALQQPLLNSSSETPLFARTACLTNSTVFRQPLGWANPPANRLFPTAGHYTGASVHDSSG